MNENNNEKDPFKTEIHVSGGEFNLNHLTALFVENNIRLLSLVGLNSQEGAEYKITENNVPLEEARITVAAPHEKVREILLNSPEFKDKVDALLGHGLN